MVLGKVLAVIAVAATSLFARPAAAETTAAAASSPWTFTFAPYGWLTFMSGTQTVAGQATTVNTNASRCSPRASRWSRS